MKVKVDSGIVDVSVSMFRAKEHRQPRLKESRKWTFLVHNQDQTMEVSVEATFAEAVKDVVSEARENGGFSKITVIGF